MPPKTLFRFGLSLLFFALIAYFSAGHWLNSRIFVPLDYAVSLDTRHLQSPPFQVNLNEIYFASLDLDYSADDWYQDNRCNFRTILHPRWWVYKLGPTPGQPRELWVSSEELVRQDFFCIFLGGTDLALVVPATARAARHALPVAAGPRIFPSFRTWLCAI